MKSIMKVDEEVRDARRHTIVQLVDLQPALEFLKNGGVVRMITVSLVVKSHNTCTLRNRRMTQRNGYKHMIIGSRFVKCSAATAPRDCTQGEGAAIAELHPGLASNSSDHTSFHDAVRQF